MYIGSENHGLFAINTSNGTLKWKYICGGQISSADPIVALDGQMIYVGGGDGILYAIHADGHQIWNYTTLGANITHNHRRPDPLATPCLSADGVTVSVGSFDGTIYTIFV